jgi:hypothetical protein
MLGIGTGVLSPFDWNPEKDGSKTESSTKLDVAVGSEFNLLDVVGVSGMVSLEHR